MAVIGLSQPGQVLLLTEGFRGQPDTIRQNVLTAGDHVLALTGNYPDFLDMFHAWAEAVEPGHDIRELASNLGQMFSEITDAPVGGVLGGFMPGGNPLLNWFHSGLEPERYIVSLPLVVVDLDESVANYLLRNLYQPLMNHREAIDFLALLGLVYALLFRAQGYADAFGIMRVRSNLAPDWVTDEELDAAIERAQLRFARARKFLGTVLVT